MERKVLWFISFAVIFVMWLKMEPSNDSRDVSVPISAELDSSPVTSSPVKNSTSVASRTEQAKDSKTPVKKAEVSKAVATAKQSTQSKVPTEQAEIVDAQDEEPAPSEAGTSDEENSYYAQHPIVTEKPDFAAFEDVKQRKEAFFKYLTPFVREKNALMLQDRENLLRIMNSEEPPGREEKRWLKALRQIFKLEDVGVYRREDIAELLLYVDIVPESLVLAQAANESAWGTSRFATEGNNYFGQWCFRKGCGLVPEARDEDADHEVRKFNDARESVFAYVDNLNSNAAYKALRKRRAELRDQGEEITGLALVHGLKSYSQRGQEYVDEIEALIEYNRLWRFNQTELAMSNKS